MINPIIVAEIKNKLGYKIIGGERRYRAAKKLGWENIDAVVTQKDPEEIALIDNLQREDLHPIEEAMAFNRLLEKRGFSQAQLAEIVSKSRTTVTKLLKLTKLDTKIKREALSDYRNISKSILLEIAQAPSEEQASYWENAKAGATVRLMRQSQAVAPKPALAEAVRSGRAFLKKLAAVIDDDLAGADAQYTRLLQIRNEVVSAINRLEERAS